MHIILEEDAAVTILHTLLGALKSSTLTNEVFAPWLSCYWRSNATSGRSASAHDEPQPVT
jgi:hypothetical protein